MSIDDNKKGKIDGITIEDEMKTSYLDYSMSVIIGRAIPDIRDGLKPVHRRTLYSLYKTNTFFNQLYKKSARIVGDVIGKYHPHGDTAVYDTLVRMAQDFSLRYTLVQGQGNFGSIDGDPPAAMRYTEVRMRRITNELLKDIDRETVDFLPNYDGTLTEPEIFPSKLPSLLLNGSSGIAVGMATSIPPHNLCEVVDAFVYFVDNQCESVVELMQFIKGPDFPTGGFIFGKYSLLNAYETGKGTVIVRAKASIETKDNSKQSIIVTQIPYQTNKAKILEKIADLVRTKKITSVSDLRDESDKDGMRIVIELKRGENPEVALNKLYKTTQLQSSFSIILLAIVNNSPKQFNLVDYFKCFLGHRKEVVKRRSRYELKKAEHRAHIIEGLKIALNKIDLVIKIIKGSPNRQSAKMNLLEQLPLTDIQAEAILELKLYRLTNLEVNKLDEEYIELLKKINYLKDLLSSEKLLLSVIKQEIIELKEKYGDNRKTTIIDQELGEINIEDLIKDEDFVIMITQRGFIKRTTLSSYQNHGRGTVGKRGFILKDEDIISKVFVASSHDYLLTFTQKGMVYWKKVYDIPEGSPHGKGKHLNRLIGISEEEKICSVINVKEFSEDKNIILFSKKGYIKKSSLMNFSRPRVNGIIAATVDPGDYLFEAQITDGTNDIIIGTSHGKSIRFQETDVRVMGRNARGVKAISLNPKDCLVGADIINENSRYILTVTENGIGKKSSLDLYRKQHRAGKGLINIKINERLGKVIGLVTLAEKGNIVLSTAHGKLIKQDATKIRAQGRATQGVIVVNLKPGDKLVSLEKIVAQEE